MTEANQSPRNRPDLVLCFLAVGLLLTLSNVATAGAQCNQVCSSQDTFYGNLAGGNTTSGVDNSAFGDRALTGLTSGSYNTALASSSLASDTTGSYNTGIGWYSLQSNTVGQFDTATGSGALQNNVSGNYNTATGWKALLANQEGSNNTATGSQALTNNFADNNTATGSQALHDNGSGYQNTADGTKALYYNTTGYNNTATGMSALLASRTAFDNTADGYAALFNNRTGSWNTGLGMNALYNNTTGQRNLAVGVSAGLNLTTGSNNIDIGAFVRGVAAESNTIRVGTQGTQTATYIAGIAGTPVTGADVEVNSSGKLGIVASSGRYKKDIRDMGATSDRLMKLRPVTFRYKNDAQGTTQYGLVAEEVEKVYPELVTYGADGKVETVRYSMLTSMLLNEVQKQERQKQELTAEIADVKASTPIQIAQLEARHEQKIKQMLAAFEGRLSTIEHAMRTRDRNRTLATALDQ